MATYIAIAQSGYIRALGGTWQIAHDAGSTLNLNPVSNAIVALSSRTGTPTVQRGFLYFDLSAIPAGSAVEVATLQVVPANIYRIAAKPNIYITAGLQENVLTTADFDIAARAFVQRDTVTDLGSVDLNTLTVDTYGSITFNVAGRAIIEAAFGGTLKLCIREQYDLDDVSPPAVSTSGLVFKSDTETDEEPRLVFTAYTSFPSDPMTRITNLIHRYNRAENLYMLEANLGEVTSDFGLPEWLAEPIPVTQEEKAKPLGPPLVGYEPEPFPDVKPGALNRYIEPFPDIAAPDTARRTSWWQAVTPWKEERGETFISAIQDLGRTLRERLFGR